ncbi:MAG: alcohol dehydrogenase family protein [Candidatus Puniceispirillaceae bacterium]
MAETNDTLPTTMQAMVLMGHGDMDQLVFHTDWPVPEIGPHEVLLKVLACGLNNTDVNTRTAWYSKGVSDATTGGAFDGADDEDATWGGAAITFPRIQGADICGEVMAVGADVEPALIGKRVMVDTWLRDWDDPLNKDKSGYFGSECDGGFAQFNKIDARHLHVVESPLSDIEIATFATAYITAENMLERANVGPGDSVLIPGASGGVGSALIQLAKRRGASAIAMASKTKHEDVARLNPDAILDRAPVDLKADLKAATGRESVSVVADVVGGDGFGHIIDVLERGGRYTCAGAIAGPIVEFDMRTFYLRDLTFTGATVVAPDLFGKLVSYINAGDVKPVLAASYPLRELHIAQQAFIDKKHVGNIVVCPWD